VVILISESLAEISPALLTNPRVVAIELPMPDQAERSAAIRHYAPHMPGAGGRLAGQTAGLRHPARQHRRRRGPGPEPGRAPQADRRPAAGSRQAEERAEKLADITAGMTPDEIRQMVDPDAPCRTATRQGNAGRQCASASAS
jgi:transitional endoplasmic reticulum ATPase